MDAVYEWRMVEEALARLFEIDDAGRPALRARLRNLQKLGLAPSSPGSGKRRKYSYFDACDLAFALSLAEFGVDPRFIVQHVTPGIVASLQDNIYCGYLPFYISRGKSELIFRSKRKMQSASTVFDRIAIINIENLKRNMFIAMNEIVRETYGNS